MAAIDLLPPDVTDVRVLGRYVLELRFGTGERRVIDVEDQLWGPVFAPLVASYEVFCQVTVDPDAGTIVWPGGADLSPTFLYARSKPSRPV